MNGEWVVKFRYSGEVTIKVWAENPPDAISSAKIDYELAKIDGDIPLDIVDTTCYPLYDPKKKE